MTSKYFRRQRKIWSDAYAAARRHPDPVQRSAQIWGTLEGLSNVYLTEETFGGRPRVNRHRKAVI